MTFHFEALSISVFGNICLLAKTSAILTVVTGSDQKIKTEKTSITIGSDSKN